MTKKYTREELARLEALAESARTPLNTRIPLSLRDNLKKLSAETDTSIQDLVTEILTRSVNQRLAQLKKKKNS